MTADYITEPATENNFDTELSGFCSFKIILYYFIIQTHIKDREEGMLQEGSIDKMKSFFRLLYRAIKNASFPILVFLFGGILLVVSFSDNNVVRNTYAFIVFTAIIWLLTVLFLAMNNLLFAPSASSVFENCFTGIKKSSRVFKKALKSLTSESYNAALQAFQQLMDMKITDKEKSVLYYFTARCYHKMGYPSNAVKYYDLAIENNFGSTDAYYNAARCCTANGMYAEAEDYYTRLHKADPDADYYYTELGMLEIKKENAEKALQYFVYSIKNKYNYAIALGGAAVACLLLHRFDESRAYYCSAIVNDISDIDSFTTYYKSIAELVGYDPNTSVGNDSGSVTDKPELMQE